MALATRIGIGAAALAACGGFLLGGPFDLVGARGGGYQPPELIQNAGCAANAPVSVAPNDHASGLRQAVNVTVSATAMIRVDAGGTVRSARTNNGCAPRAGDDFFVFQPDGSIHAALAVEFAEHTWTGDFTVPGEFVDQVG